MRIEAILHLQVYITNIPEDFTLEETTIAKPVDFGDFFEFTAEKKNGFPLLRYCLSYLHGIDPDENFLGIFQEESVQSFMKLIQKLRKSIAFDTPINHAFKLDKITNTTYVYGTFSELLFITDRLHKRFWPIQCRIEKDLELQHFFKFLKVMRYLNDSTARGRRAHQILNEMWAVMTQTPKMSHAPGFGVMLLDANPIFRAFIRFLISKNIGYQPHYPVFLPTDDGSLNTIKVTDSGTRMSTSVIGTQDIHILPHCLPWEVDLPSDPPILLPLPPYSECPPRGPLYSDGPDWWKDHVDIINSTEPGSGFHIQIYGTEIGSRNLTITLHCLPSNTFSLPPDSPGAIARTKTVEACAQLGITEDDCIQTIPSNILDQESDSPDKPNEPDSSPENAPSEIFTSATSSPFRAFCNDMHEILVRTTLVAPEDFSNQSTHSSSPHSDTIITTPPASSSPRPTTLALPNPITITSTTQTCVEPRRSTLLMAATQKAFHKDAFVRSALPFITDLLLQTSFRPLNYFVPTVLFHSRRDIKMGPWVDSFRLDLYKYEAAMIMTARIPVAYGSALLKIIKNETLAVLLEELNDTPANRDFKKLIIPIPHPLSEQQLRQEENLKSKIDTLLSPPFLSRFYNIDSSIYKSTDLIYQIDDLLYDFLRQHGTIPASSRFLSLDFCLHHLYKILASLPENINPAYPGHIYLFTSSIASNFKNAYSSIQDIKDFVKDHCLPIGIMTSMIISNRDIIKTATAEQLCMHLRKMAIRKALVTGMLPQHDPLTDAAFFQETKCSFCNSELAWAVVHANPSIDVSLHCYSCSLYSTVSTHSSYTTPDQRGRRFDATGSGRIY